MISEYMDKHDLKPGDTVRLKSGGPLMTVEGVGRYGQLEDNAKCVWFESVKGQQVKKQDYFTLSLLVKE
jgi:uncharacterized protein YodC (DUF2158 family)